ncbi:MAG: TonB-dependent receptor domain-containing protein, partial [Draconibacterium sp.]
AVFGGNNRSFNSRNLSVDATSLSIPGVYNIGNSSVPVGASNYNNDKVVNSLYGSINVGYANMLYLTLTGRNDWSSAMPINHNSYFYPSVTLSGIITEMIKLPEVISFAKVRGSWIKVGGDMSPYSVRQAYNYGTTWNTTPSIYMGSVLPSGDIEPDFKTTYELGGDIRFFKNRLGFDLTYYNDLESNMITNSAISITSGYSSRKINSSKKTRRVGWELALTASPVRTNDFSWNVGLNWSSNSQYLVRAEEGKEGRDGYVKEGEKYGYLWLKSEIDRSSDGRVIYRNGLPVVTTDAQNFGYARNRWEAGFNNSIIYKNFTFSFSIDGRWGGLIYSRLNQKLWESGLHAQSASSETSAYRDADNLGNKTYIGDGLIVTGGDIERDAYGTIINDTRTYKENDIPIFYRSWVNRYYNAGRYNTSTFDATFFKLREVIIGYRIPNSIVEKVHLNGAEVSFIGRNLFLWTKEDGNIDPDVNAYQGETRLYVPTPRNIGFNIKLNF